MSSNNSNAYPPVSVQGTRILATDTRQQYREKIARIALDNMVQLVGIIDPDGMVLEINPAALNAVGYKLSDVEGRPLWTTCWWTVNEEVNTNLRNSIKRAAAGEAVHWETPIYGSGGRQETMIIDASLSPIFDDNGKVVFICAEGRDITEKKALEREIAQKNTELQGLLERISGLDEVKTRFFANVSHELRTPQALQITDVAAAAQDTILVVEDDPGMNKFIVQCLSDEYNVISAFNGEEGLRKALRHLPALIVSDIMMSQHSGVEMIDEIRRHPDLADIPILLLSARADEELKIDLLWEKGRDFITKPFNERDLRLRIRNLLSIRKYNRELKSHSRQLSELFEQTPSFMAIVRGPNHVYELANEAYYKLVGHRQLIGKPLREALPEIEGQGIMDLLDRVYVTGEPYSGVGVPVHLQRTPNSIPEPRYVNFIYQPLLDAKKNIAGVFIEGHDVTAEVLTKKLLLENEERLKEQSLSLEKQVLDRTKALKELNESLKTSNEDLQQFAHVASHDLKEPIRKIKTFGERLRDDYSQLLPEKAAGFLEKILSATDRAYAMINGVLAYSTMVAEDQPSSIVDLNTILKSIEADLEVLIQDKKATINVGPLPCIEGYPVLLYQLFYNLVNNSIKFSKPTEPPAITVTSTTVEFEQHQVARIILADNGIGFAQEHAERIFTTFTRLNARDKYEGTGLGLALCKKIVQRHNGFISAHGEKGKGAEFTILLPL